MGINSGQLAVGSWQWAVGSTAMGCWQYGSGLLAVRQWAVGSTAVGSWQLGQPLNLQTMNFKRLHTTKFKLRNPNLQL